MDNNVLKKFNSGEIVSIDSLMAFDEDITCKRCKAVFTLAEGRWKGTHQKYSGVEAHGLKCPNCERVNVSYYKTKTLNKYEKRLKRLYEESKSIKQTMAALRKYQKEFMNVQKRYGGIERVSETKKD